MTAKNEHAALDALARLFVAIVCYVDAENAKRAARAAVGPAFRGAREASGLSLRAFASMAGVSHAFVNQIEHGERLPTKAVLDAMSGVCANMTSKRDDMNGGA